MHSGMIIIMIKVSMQSIKEKLKKQCIYLQCICTLHFLFNVGRRIPLLYDEKCGTLTFSLITNSDVFNSTKLASNLTDPSHRISGQTPGHQLSHQSQQQKKYSLSRPLGPLLIQIGTAENLIVMLQLQANKQERLALISVEGD